MRLTRFLLLTALFTAPLWLAAAFIDATEVLPINLPFSALSFISVLLAAIIETRLGKESIRGLLKRGVALKSVKSPVLLVAVIIMMPAAVILSYFIAVWAGAAAEYRMTPLFNLPVFLLMYGIAAFCEEIGWTAVMTDMLLKRYSVLKAGIAAGLVWSLWHLIPFIQTHNTIEWIFWQSVFTVLFRVLLAKLYVVTQRSVLSAIILHATYNTAAFMLPYYGSSYAPVFMTITAAILTLTIYAVFRARREKTL